jgi:hypothetical protein
MKSQNRKNVIRDIFWGSLQIGCGYIFYDKGYFPQYGVPVPRLAGVILMAVGILYIGYSVYKNLYRKM